MNVAVGRGVLVGGGGGGGSSSPITRTMSDAGDPTSYSAKTGFTRTRMVLSVGVLSGTPYETAATSISPARNAKACRSAVWSVDGSNIWTPPINLPLSVSLSTICRLALTKIRSVWPSSTGEGERLTKLILGKSVCSETLSLCGRGKGVVGGADCA